MSNISVIHGGFLTTVQDQGRYGYQEFGITTSGVMDEYSYRLANALVGNDRGEAVLEITYIGPMLKFHEEMVFAVTGGEVHPKLDGKEIPMWQSIRAKAGQTLSFGKPGRGIRAYLAFGGSIDIPVVNGSKSTLLKSKMGGYKGRNIKPKDEFSISINPKAKEGKTVSEEWIPTFDNFQVLRVILGPQDDYFTEQGIHDLFCSGGYMVTREMDRMGIRLKGETLEHIDSSDIVSDGTVMGSIQVPANGLPIILMADRQTTGGYTKIGTIIREDLPKAGQLQFLDKICFQEISLEEAQKSYRQYEERLCQLEEELKQ